MKKNIFFIIVLAVAFVLGATRVFAWTNPAANPATGGGTIIAEQGSPANVIYIKSNGNVGIGTANPETERKFEVMGGSSGWHTASFIGASGVGVSIGYSGSETDGSIQAFDRDLSAPERYMNLLLNNAGGNVGIGNIVPGSKLTVAGIVESTSGGFKFPDATIQTTAFAGGSQTLSAANVSSGNFGENTGGGNYFFPGQAGFGNFTIRSVTVDSIGIYDSVGALVVEFDEGI